ncbi:chaperone NapD [Zobellella denitrificans]|jgi:nitrate reductase NapD|uniref:Chaperone NapD n=1 Tax=Zobellella denitrificans TaxID=347534 RepID=A0A291HQP7_9GAMM|nr:chaperone NapD [Zobellella denitrificans]ATG74381.1 nitrate reductase formation protein NapD [Zobellella denitrificans]
MSKANEWHVASLVVYCRPELMGPAQEAISAMDGVEVPVSGEQGKLVVAIEGPTQKSVVSRIDQIALLEGILSTTLIYHEFAELEAGEEQQ